MKKDYCDVCGRMKELQEVVLRDESGTAFYCADCKRENRRISVKDWERKNAIRELEKVSRND